MKRGRVSGLVTRTLTTCVAGLALFGGEAVAQQTRPNIVFIGAEDISADLGCYGNTLVHTPNLDRLASQGAVFKNAYVHCPVSAPSRSGMITGMYPTTIGTHHMRSKLLSPPRTFTQELRDAGYYVRWATKTDFNFDPPKDGFDSTEPWLNDGAIQEIKAQRQPFFLHVNFMTTHESHVFGDKEAEAHAAKLAPEQRIDPAKVIVPPFYPDTPEVRRDIARYLNNISAMDQEVGEVLDLLERNGLSDNTLIMFWGDNGRGMPRHKRWCYRSGIRVPLIVRWSGKIAPGTVREDLVSTIDVAPMFLTVAGAPVPERMQGKRS